jgi:hypothetical protein
MTRRHALRILAASSVIPTVSITSCIKQAVIEGTALVGVFIGSRLVEFPNPFAKIIGIILKVGSEIVLSGLDTNQAAQSFSTKISMDESHQFQQTRNLTFKRHDGTTETQAIQKEEYA